MSQINDVFKKNYFLGYPVEYHVPESAQVIFVSDFFANEMQGGAELTSEAILEKCPYKTARLHSSSVSLRLMEENKNKYWVFGNYTMLPTDSLEAFSASKIKYSIIEFDFKFCAFRSPQLHLQNSGKACNCANDYHGKLIEKFYINAEKLFWMSEGQRNYFFENVPILAKLKDHDIVQSSTFTEETLNLLNSLCKRYEKTSLKDEKVYSILGEGTWIKGVEDTAKWCSLNNIKFRSLGKMPYREFLESMAQGYGFVFQPRDYDTCPRVVIEAKLLGNELILNNNVQHKDEEWFKGTRDQAEAYLRNRGQKFWEQIKL